MIKYQDKKLESIKKASENLVLCCKVQKTF